MTRGKNASRAANRQAALDDATAGLRRRIATLEAEVETLDCRNLEQQAVHVEETRKMRMLITANTSERLEDALVQLTEARRIHKISEDARMVGAESINRLMDALQTSYEAAGMKTIDAREATLKVAKYVMSHINDTVPGFIKVDDINTTAGMANASKRCLFESDADPEELLQMHRLQRAKGLRS